jgi:hypothetical protein
MPPRILSDDVTLMLPFTADLFAVKGLDVDTQTYFAVQADWYTHIGWQCLDAHAYRVRLKDLSRMFT